MTFPRTYAPQLPVPHAIAELRRCAGAQFDPSVVDALANLIVGLTWPPERSLADAGTLDRVPDHA